jgi:hypothetical protein
MRIPRFRRQLLPRSLPLGRIAASQYHSRLPLRPRQPARNLIPNPRIRPGNQIQFPSTLLRRHHPLFILSKLEMHSSVKIRCKLQPATHQQLAAVDFPGAALSAL